MCINAWLAIPTSEDGWLAAGHCKNQNHILIEHNIRKVPDQPIKQQCSECNAGILKLNGTTATKKAKRAKLPSIQNIFGIEKRGKKSKNWRLKCHSKWRFPKGAPVSIFKKLKKRGKNKLAVKNPNSVE